MNEYHPGVGTRHCRVLTGVHESFRIAIDADFCLGAAGFLDRSVLLERSPM
ncbi:MAG: hypothetical protein AB1861_12485 [Cyanobacteriota bacterium]